MSRSRLRRQHARGSLKVWRTKPRRGDRPPVRGAAEDVHHSVTHDLCGTCGYLLNAHEEGPCPACNHDDRLSLSSELVTDRLSDDLEALRNRVPLRTQLLGTLVGSWTALGVMAMAASVEHFLWSAVPAAGAVVAGGVMFPSKAARKHASLAQRPICRWRAPLPHLGAAMPGGDWTGVVRSTEGLTAPWSGRPCVAYRWRVSLSGSDSEEPLLVLDETRSAACTFGAFDVLADRLRFDEAAMGRIVDVRPDLDGELRPADRAASACLRSRGFRPHGVTWHVTEDILVDGTRVDVMSRNGEARVRPHVHHLAVA